jgi:ribosomal protein S18 acetylase RimI-like enzyme
VGLITSLARETAHVAQIAVRADRRGEGLARRMLVAAARAARGEGRMTMTLLVGDGNHSARRLYAALGFAQRTEFIAARISVGSGA